MPRRLVNGPVAQITCVDAPAAQANYDYYEDLSPESFTKILDDLLAGKTVKPGPQVARQLSAPSGGPTHSPIPRLYARAMAGRRASQR